MFLIITKCTEIQPFMDKPDSNSQSSPNSKKKKFPGVVLLKGVAGWLHNNNEAG